MAAVVGLVVAGVVVKGPREEYHHDRQLRHPLVFAGQPRLHPHSSSGDIGSKCTTQGNMSSTCTSTAHTHTQHMHIAFIDYYYIIITFIQYILLHYYYIYSVYIITLLLHLFSTYYYIAILQYTMFSTKIQIHLQNGAEIFVK